MTETTKLARQAKVGRWLLVASTTIACLLGVYAVAVNVNQGKDITNVNQNVTKIERSACQRSTDHPGNVKAAKECAEIRAHIARSEPVENPCISYQRVTGEKGRNCGRFFVDVSRGGRAESIDAAPLGSAAPSGGDASDAHTGSSQPGRHEGGSGKAGHPEHHHPSKVPGGKGGGGEVPAAPSPTPEGSTGSTSSSVTKRVESTVVETKPQEVGAPGLVGALGEGVGTTVQETGHTVNETVKGATCAIGLGEC